MYNEMELQKAVVGNTIEALKKNNKYECASNSNKNMLNEFDAEIGELELNGFVVLDESDNDVEKDESIASANNTNNELSDIDSEDEEDLHKTSSLQGEIARSAENASSSLQNRRGRFRRGRGKGMKPFRNIDRPYQTNKNRFQWRMMNNDSNWNAKATMSKNEKRLYEQKFKCEECAYEAIQRKSLRIHISRYHKGPRIDGVYKCKVCSFETTAKRTFKRHLRDNHVTKKKMFRCKKCALETMCRATMKQHNRECFI